MLTPHAEQCEVCRRSPAKEKRKSTLGDFSFDYCRTCTKRRAEPQLFVFAVIEQYGGWQEVPQDMSLVYYAEGSYHDPRAEGGEGDA